jgi:hypothetical protein
MLTTFLGLYGNPFVRMDRPKNFFVLYLSFVLGQMWLNGLNHDRRNVMMTSRAGTTYQNIC